jgi:hypothetical protein
MIRAGTFCNLPCLFQLVVQQPGTVLIEVVANGAAAKIQLVGVAAIKLLAAIGEASARAHTGTGTRTQEQGTGDQHDFEEIRFHFSVPFGCKHGHTQPEAIILCRRHT